jgi:hypothetical protein
MFSLHSPRRSKPRAFASVAAHLAVVVGISIAAAVPAHAERLLVVRGGDLYTAAPNGSSPQRLFSLVDSNASGDSAMLLFCAASPDGRRFAWATAPRPPAASAQASGAPPTAPSDLESRPVTVYLSDLSGVHEKRLFSTDTLHDRRGKRVMTLGAELPTDPGDDSPLRQPEQWEPTSLAWSADSRTLYLCCRLLSVDTAARATFAVDGATGVALVDGEGRWKSVAPVTDVDARGAAIVGVGVMQTAAPTVSDPTTGAARPLTYSPLVLINLAEGQHTTLFSPAPPPPADQAPAATTAVAQAPPLPDYAFALAPALSGNDNRFVAFTSVNKGLWLLDRTALQYRLILDLNVSHPRWTPSATGLFFLEPHPQSATGKPTSDLYAAPFVPATGELGIPQFVLQDAWWFDVVPE